MQSTITGQGLPSAASASTANASTATAPSDASLQTHVGEGVLLVSPVRLRTGLSWYRPARAKLFAPQQDGVTEASTWSALEVDGEIVQCEEVAGVRIYGKVLEFIVERKPARSTTAQDKPAENIHLRMFTHNEFNLWREVLCPEIHDPTLPMGTESKPSAIEAAHKWLVDAEAADLST